MKENKGRTAQEVIDDEEEDEDTQKDKYLIFRLGNEDYGAEISYVNEIIGVQKITDVPDMPDFVKGVINLRGRVIPVVDVRTRFHMQPRAYDDRTCVIVVRLNEMDVGLVVDIVREVISIPEAQITTPPQMAKRESHRFVKGMGKVGDDVKILLDLNQILDQSELEKMGNA
jgi:purine-binding chemotaxis protein CheW